jgi:glutathione peroxidase
MNYLKIDPKNLLLLFAFILINVNINAQNDKTENMNDTKKSFYEYSAAALDGEEISMDKYKGQVVLIVNTASECGFTPQYEGLEELHKKYGNNGLNVLGFPCNQFGKQEPGSDKEIAQFCKLNFGVSFQMFSKIDVNGENEDPLYTYLKKEQGSILGNSIKWNFTKFLVDKNGKVVERYGSTTKPESIEKDIKKYL